MTDGRRLRKGVDFVFSVGEGRRNKRRASGSECRPEVILGLAPCAKCTGYLPMPSVKLMARDSVTDNLAVSDVLIR